MVKLLGLDQLMLLWCFEVEDGVFKNVKWLLWRSFILMGVNGPLWPFIHIELSSSFVSIECSEVYWGEVCFLTEFVLLVLFLLSCIWGFTHFFGGSAACSTCCQWQSAQNGLNVRRTTVHFWHRTSHICCSAGVRKYFRKAWMLSEYIYSH